MHMQNVIALRWVGATSLAADVAHHDLTSKYEMWSMRLLSRVVTEQRKAIVHFPSSGWEGGMEEHMGTKKCWC